MAEPKVRHYHRPALHTGGFLWGPIRVERGMGITELARRSGVNMGTLSLMENGRLIPTGDEFHRIMVALGLIAEQVE